MTLVQVHTLTRRCHTNGVSMSPPCLRCRHPIVPWYPPALLAHSNCRKDSDRSFWKKEGDMFHVP